MEQSPARPPGEHVAVLAARNGDLLSQAGSKAGPEAASGAGARSGASTGAGAGRRRGAYQPYLDRIALSATLADTSGEFWRRLLIQPVVLPDMAHTGIRTMFDNPEEGDLLGPDGRTTRRLKALIQTRVVDEQREAEEALSPKSGQSPGKKSPKASGRAQEGLLLLDASLHEAEREGETTLKRASPVKLRKPQAAPRPGCASPSPTNNGDSLDLLNMTDPVASLDRAAKPREGDLKGAPDSKSGAEPKKKKKKKKAKRAPALQIPGQRQQRKEPFSYSASRLFELILERTYGK
jgi:hypothetical protein